ncbi:hypothetical protein OC842_006380 [Tilletia horrida]|uniref:Uncharacterized protein n=1 Tax=Tilletia horrida TaxID=155126 RepID=A0AAN6G7Z1_9BASI|nr:hypothetical protein OC842_006380 [Tilletia horrida]
MDVSGPARDMVFLYGFVIDGRLDADKLKQAWQQLCQTWPILSARFRQGANSKSPQDWHYLLPPDAEVQAVVEADMSDSCPAGRRSLVVDEIESKVRDFHPFVEGRDLPQDRPTLHHAAWVRDTRPKTRSKLLLNFASNAPLTVDHLFTEDRPVATAKITRFADATTIGLALPHVLCDGLGAELVVRAWAALANGEGEHIKPLPGLGQDPFAALAPGGKVAQEEMDAAEAAGHEELPPPAGWHAYSVLQTALFLAHYMWDVIWARPEATMEQRELFLPKAYLNEQKAAAMAEIKSKPSAGDDDYVSTSDICIAIALKRMCAPDARGPDDARLFSFVHPANLRYMDGAAQSVALPKPYLHNAIHAVALADIPIGKLVYGLSVGELALELRRALQRESKPEAIRRSLVWCLANVDKFIAFFRPSSFWVGGTNWRSMKLHDVSFAKALETSSAATGRPFKIYMQAISRIPMRNMMVIVGDDATGGIWVNMTLSASQWRRIEQAD